MAVGVDGEGVDLFLECFNYVLQGSNLSGNYIFSVVICLEMFLSSSVTHTSLFMDFLPVLVVVHFPDQTTLQYFVVADFTLMHWSRRS